MSDRAANYGKWPASRVVLLAGLIFAAQLDFLFFASRQRAETGPSGKTALSIALAGASTEGGSFVSMRFYQEPGLLLTAHPQGFSSDSWDRRIEAIAPDPMWIEPELWLSQDSSGLNSAFLNYVQNHAEPAVRAARKPAPSVFQRPAWEDSMPIGSYVALQGALSNFSVLKPLELPDITHDGPIPPTVVEAGFNDNGQALSCRVIQSSGVPKADSAALKALSSVKLKLKEGSAVQDIHWGYLEFHWRTAPPAPESNPQGQP